MGGDERVNTGTEDTEGTEKPSGAQWSGAGRGPSAELREFVAIVRPGGRVSERAWDSGALRVPRESDVGGTQYGAPMDRPGIICETPTWLVVAKPAGWHTVQGKTEALEAAEQGGGVLESWLATERPELAELPESGLVHRLDRDTSGCVVVAKDRETHTELGRRFREGLGVRKFYLARCATGLREEGSATLFFTSRHKGSIKITVKEMGEVRDAGRFRWRVLARDRSRGDLIELELIGPGKRHELRGGCAYLGHPLVGDELYGGVASATLCLHASRVEIDGTEARSPKPAWV